MRLARAEPEAEGLARPALFEEVLEVPRVVVVRHAAERRLAVMPGIARPGRVAGESAGFMVAGAPALARVADVIAGALEQVGEDRPLGRKEAEMVDSLLELPGVPARQVTRAAGGALGVGREEVREQDAFVRHQVECRCMHPAASVRPGMGPPPGHRRWRRVCSDAVAGRPAAGRRRRVRWTSGPFRSCLGRVAENAGRTGRGGAAGRAPQSPEAQKHTEHGWSSGTSRVS